MALPPQRLLNDDLFVINRIEANDVDTYKINADAIGIFLLEAPRPPGSSPDDKFVNDGPLNVYGELPDSGLGYINLHSANEYCEGKLTFSEGFYVSGVPMDVYIEHDYAEIAKNLACLNGGIDGTTTCLKLDMNWLSENIICTGGGLESTGDCIQINLCKHSGLNFESTDGCLEVSLCPGRGIIHHPSDGCLDVDLNYLSQALSCNGLQPSEGKSDAVCMEIDMVWLAANIRCGEPTDPSAEAGSGLIDSQDGCIAVDPCWVSDQWNLDNPNTPDDVQSIDIAECELAINHDWLLQWAKDNINEIKTSGDCISGGGNLFKEEVTIALDVDCIRSYVCSKNGTLTIKDDTGSVLGTYSPCDGDSIIEIESGGGSVDPPGGGDPCKNGGILEDPSGCLYLDKSDTGCTEQAFINCAGVNVRQSNGINFNTGGSSVAGLNLNVGNKSMRLAYDLKNDGSGPCANYNGGTNVIRLSLGGSGTGVSGRLFRTECLTTKGDSNDQAHNDEGVIVATRPGTGRHELKIDPTLRSSYPQYITEDDKIDYQAREDNRELYENENPFQDFYDANPPNTEDVVDSVSLSSISDFDSNIDNIVDTLGESKAAGGMFRWGKVKNSITQEVKLFFDPNELGSVSPLLAKSQYSRGSYEGTFDADEDEWDEGNLKPEDQRNINYYQTNQDALTVLSFMAHKRARTRLNTLTELTTQSGLLSLLGICEYENNTSANNAGLQVGDMYWDTTRDRLRAVT